jgi:hypothetical protein
MQISLSKRVTRTAPAAAALLVLGSSFPAPTPTLAQAASFVASPYSSVFITVGLQHTPNELYFPINGNGTLGSPSTIPNIPISWPSQPIVYGTDVADLDNDGDADFLICEATSSTVYKYVNDGSGSFTRSVVASGVTSSTASTDLRTADFNRDGLQDFVVGDWFDHITRVYLQGPVGTYTAAHTLSNPGLVHAGAQGVAVGDVTGDGNPDIVMCDDMGRYPPAPFDVWLHEGYGDGTFGGPVGLISPNADFGFRPSSIAAFDRDLDGDLDLVLGHRYSRDNYFYTNDGTGHFDAPGGPDFRTTASASLDAFDFDGDGREDVVSVDHNGNLHVVRNTGFRFATPIRTTVPGWVGSVGAPPSYDTVVQDDANGWVLKWGSIGGSYYFCGDQQVRFGRAPVGTTGCERWIELRTEPISVEGHFDQCGHRATGSLRFGSSRFRLNDSYTLDDTGLCGGP